MVSDLIDISSSPLLYKLQTSQLNIDLVRSCVFIVLV
jgi:hypothetical protein